MNTKHTPKPWRWEIRGDTIILHNPTSAVPILKAKGFVKEQDGPLIAAAPELAEALAALASAFQIHNPNHEEHEDWRQARAALQKAGVTL